MDENNRRMAMRRACFAALAGVAMLTSGCDLLKDGYTTNVAFNEGGGTRKVTAPGDMRPFDLLSSCMPSDLVGPPEKPASCPVSTMRRISEMDPKGADPAQALARDRFQDYLIWRSEQQCEAHKAGILGIQSSVNFVFNTVTTGVAAVAAIVTAPATNILAAIAAISSGTRAHFNEDVYEKLIAPAVVKKISEDRSQKLLDIQAKRTVQNKVSKDDKPAPREAVLMKDYTLEQAVGDVERYHQLCSFESGLSSLVDPKQKFDETAAGIKQRIDMLRDMQTSNETQAAAMEKTGDTTAKETAKRMRETNNDIARQIMVLQQQMLTAPLTVDTPAKK